ncbi:hypothetical protein [Streptomyces sp. CA-106131]|uniref:hypothetical protein n=1 Tax=Streptomyces sp. CA-106131 TaxID=3240045 RepID=UPI003D8FB646
MSKHVPPRLRAPLKIVALGVAVGALMVALHGWATGPIVILASLLVLAPISYYVWSGRDSDTASAVRGQMDERQAYRRLQVQALVGRVMSLAAAIGYLIAVSINATLWPFAVALGLPVLTAIGGWAFYGDRHEEEG